MIYINAHDLPATGFPTGDVCMTWTDGTKTYHRNGMRHRTDGPAAEYANGKYMWCLNGDIYLNNKEFQKAANISDEDMAVMIMKYGNVE